MLGFRNKVISKIRRLLKNIRVISSVPKQQKIAKNLDGYIADFLNGKIKKFVATPKKIELVGKNIFWQYWHQGVDENTSKMVVECLESVQKYKGDYEVILLTNETVWDYVELPDFVFEKFGKNGFNFAKLANLVRLYLLASYGGVWLDATIYLTATIDKKILDEDFFAFQRSKIPPTDARIFQKFDPLYFSWSPTFLAGMLNSFMVAKPGNKIIADLLSIHLEYWKNETKVGHYYLFQILFNRMMQHDEWGTLNCEIVGDTDCHKLQVMSLDKFNQRTFDEIKAKSSIHKLTYRFDKFSQIPEGSFFDYIANGKIK
jgi:mannosyltransferase OCH1-like enzyme